MNKKLNNYILLSLIILLSFSCNKEILPDENLIKANKILYIGSIKLEIYNIKKCSEIETLKNYPKSTNDFKVIKWNLISKDTTAYNELVSYLNYSYPITKNQEHIIQLKNLISSINSNKESFYISGYYVLRLKNTVDYYNHFYFIYLIDIKNNKLYVFDLRNYW